VHWTREALETRVDKLAAEHEGDELVVAMQAFADQLGDHERELLGRVLLERARAGRGATHDYPKWNVILPRPRRRRRP
jgi:hypothetical protein